MGKHTTQTVSNTVTRQITDNQQNRARGSGQTETVRVESTRVR